MNVCFPRDARRDRCSQRIAQLCALIAFDRRS